MKHRVDAIYVGAATTKVEGKICHAQSSRSALERE